MSAIDAVVFDIGGVVMESPLHAIARYERHHGLPARAIGRAVVASGESGAWARLERGELTLESFCTPFEADCRAHGVEVSGTRLIAYIAEASVPRPRMLAAIRTIRGRALRVSAQGGRAHQQLEAGWAPRGRRSPRSLRRVRRVGGGRDAQA